jgi:hypothetical protein
VAQWVGGDTQALRPTAERVIVTARSVIDATDLGIEGAKTMAALAA